MEASPFLHCEKVQKDYFTIDGVLDDWSELPNQGIYKLGRDRVSIRCAYDEKNLYVGVVVFDQKIIRGKVGDRLDFSFGQKTVLYVEPRGGKQKAVFRVAAGGQVDQSATKRAWHVEGSIPLTKLPGGNNVGFFEGTIRVRDTDKRSARARSSKRALTFATADGVAALKGFLSRVGAVKREISFQKVGGWDSAPGVELLVVAKQYVGIVGQQFLFVRLPASHSRDVLKARYFATNGGDRLLVHFREGGPSGGSREVVTLMGAKSGGFSQFVAVEVGKKKGTQRIETRWTPRVTNQGVEIRVVPKAATGWSSDTYQERPATDAVPIVLPWNGKSVVVTVSKTGAVHVKSVPAPETIGRK